MPIPNRHPTPAQFRASRAALDWSLAQAAQQARLSVSSVLRCERERGGDPSAAVLHALRACYELSGIGFAQGEGEGIQLTPASPVRFAL